MDISFLTNYLVLGVVAVCLCVGYVIKTSFEKIPNKYIPLIMLVLGTITNIIINKSVNMDILLGGMVSGLASTGLHQIFKAFLDNPNKKN